MRFHLLFLRRTVVFAIAAVLLATSFATAEPTYSLQLRMSAGEKWAFDITNSLKQKGQVIANGQRQPLDRQINGHRKGTIEILAVEQGMPTAVRVTYSTDSSMTGDLGGQPVPPFTLAGKTVIVRKQAGVISNNLPDQADVAAVQEVNQMVEPDTSIYAKEPVAVNQEWDGDASALSRQFQLAGNDTISIKCKLLAVKEVAGRQVADIGVTGSVVKVEQNVVETRINLSGVTRVDIQTGQPIASDVTGKFAIRNIPMPGPAANISVQGDGEIQIHQVITSAAADAPPSSVVNNPPVVPPQIPLPPPAGNGPFVGSYKSDQIQLVLSGTAEDYTGTLTVAGKSYPVAAKPDGNKLTGTFESEGAKFNFTGSIDGETLTLTSEGNTYTLKKTPNPTRNPLAR